MQRHVRKRLCRGLMIGTLFMAYQAPGCTFDQASLQSWLGNYEEIKIEIELDPIDNEEGDNL